MKDLTYLKNKLAVILAALLNFIRWSKKHRSVMIPVNIILMILLGLASVSITKKIIGSSDFAAIYNILRGKCDSCKQELPPMQSPNDFFRHSGNPASIPDYFYKTAEQPAPAEKEP